jgi:type VI secretion system protein VasG
VVQLIASRCTELESGGRMIDAILTHSMLPAISREFLNRLLLGSPASQVQVRVEDSEFIYVFTEQE